MKYQTDDLRISGMQEVLAPEELMQKQPISPASSKLIYESITERSIFDSIFDSKVALHIEH